VRDRIVAVVRSWFAEETGGAYVPRVLSNDSLDLAVAQGAAYYGVVRRGGGIRIGGGTARSVYVGLEMPDPSAPPWLCVVPRDAQEGDTVTVEGHDLELRLGEPVAFPLASSSVRPQDRPGDLAPRDPDSIRDLPPLVGLMKTGRKAKADRVGVQLTARVTEVGTVELWCASRGDDRRWRLQVQLRGPSNPGGAAPGGVLASIVGQAEADAAVLEQKFIDKACEAVTNAFAAANARDEPGPSRLVKALEEVLELPREQWPPSALRALWVPLRDAMDRRKVSPRRLLPATRHRLPAR
jgi:hypothetical protein